MHIPILGRGNFNDALHDLDRARQLASDADVEDAIAQVKVAKRKVREVLPIIGFDCIHTVFDLIYL
jgi:hypothetical protein